MASVSAWLATLGLERYAAAFDEAEIDLDTLPHLTEDDLKEIGLPLGPRRRILAARGLADPAGAPPQPAAGPPPAGEPPARAEPDASAPERRQMTVLFVDLVGSTHMSTRIDPEELNDLLQAYKAVAAGAIEQSAGMVAKYLGDGVLAYFGWPQAREDAAECAIRCAFTILDGAGRLKDPDGRPVQCRVGIATGLAVVGGLTGRGNAREDTVAGEVLNLAARLQAVAEPDQVVIADSTHRMVGQLFDCEPLGAVELKGFDQPVQAWRAVREALHTNRFAAARAIRTSLIGREQELSMLAGRWRDAGHGEGRAVLILGEAGIGKSRLSEALHGHVLETPHTYVSWQCSAFHQTKALYPVIEYIKGAAEIADSDAPEIRLGKLSQLLATIDAPLDEMLPLFADVLAIPPGAGYAAPEMLPTQRRAATIAALCEWVGRIAELNPLLLLLEDAHWADATTLDLIARVVTTIGRRPILALITSRPGFTAPWIGGSGVSIMGLDRLNSRESEALVREIAQSAALQPSIIEQVLAKSDGNPLFLEELSLTVFDPRLPRGQTVPDSLQSSLMARLDRLGEAKRTAQTCAVLGRRFALPLLLRVAGQSAEALDTALTTLVDNDILYPVGRIAEGRYEFKHALVRDAAYGSLLLSQRRILHEACARNLADAFPDVVETEPELIAHHFANADRPSDASLYSERAGDRASAAYAYAEAIASYRTAVAQNAATPTGEARDQRELALLLKLGAAVVIIKGPQHAEVCTLYSRAEALARGLDDTDRLFKSVWGLWYNANIGRDLDGAAARAEELLKISRRSGDARHALEALHSRWSSEMFRGEHAASVADATRGAELYDRDRDHALGLQFGGHDPAVCAIAVKGACLSILGDLGDAVEAAERAITLAEDLEHQHSVAHALLNAVTMSVTSRDYALLQRYAERLFEISQKYNFPPMRLGASFFLGWLEAQVGDAAAGWARMQAEFPQAMTTAPMPMVYAAHFGEELMRQGRPEDALSVADQALGALKQSGIGIYLPEIHRLRGCSLQALGGHGARETLQRARSLAQEQGLATFELRALISEMEIAPESEARTQLQQGLRTALAKISGGEGRPDVVRAQALL